MATLKTKLDSLQKKAKERTVKTQTIEYDLETLVKKIKKNVIKLDPEYQRRHRWDTDTSSRLIESLILNIPIPFIYISQDIDVDVEDDDSELARYSVIDGQQRLTAIKDFFSNELKLNGLQTLEDLNGATYKDLPPFLIRRLEERMVRILRIDSTLDQQVKFDIFERLNSGSVRLEPQELRNATHRGPFNKIIKELAGTKDFMALLQINPENPSKSRKVAKMEDVELVLRFYSLLDGGYKDFKKEWKAFLTEKMATFNKLSEEDLANYKSLFIKTMKLTRQKFGDQAFAKYKIEDGERIRTSKFNRAVYDALSTSIACLVKKEVEDISDEAVKDYNDLFHDNDFFESISGTINFPQNVRTRIEKVKAIICK